MKQIESVTTPPSSTAAKPMIASDRAGMNTWKRRLGTASLVAFVTLPLAVCAYFVGLWPQRLDVTVEGPAGWGLTRVDTRVVASPLPAACSKSLGLLPDGRDVACTLEVAHGAERARGRVRAWNGGGFKTGHRALHHGVESLDGSLWLLGDAAVTVHPAAPGRVWFGCNAWGRTALRIDGAPSESLRAHAHSTPAVNTWRTIASDDWTLSYLADAGTAIHLGEWGSPTETIVRCDEAGFTSGTLVLDGAPPQPLALHAPAPVAARKFALELHNADGRRAQVRFERWSDLRLTLRISQ